MIKQGYLEPKLHDCGGDLSKEWFVDFRYTCPSCQVRKPYQHRMGINFLKTAAERRAEGKAVADLLLDALKADWNPHHEDIEDYLKRLQQPKAAAVTELGSMGFNAALEYALDSKKANLEPKSYSGFKTAKEYAKAAASTLGYDIHPIRDIKRAHIKEILNQIVKDRQEYYNGTSGRFKGKKVTGNFFNKYKGYLGCILSELVEYEAMEYNPCDKIKNKPKIKTNKHRHATQRERDMIKSHLQLNYPEFYYYLLTEYMAGIRPKEIFYIRICDIDWFNQTFNVYPYDGATKDKENRKVPIPNALMKYLKAMKLERHNPTHFLFSKGFRPGAERKKRDFATKTWHQEVRTKLGLDVSLYSFKGLGGDDKRAAGIPLHAVSSQYGHSNLGTTMIYTRGEQDRMNRDIIELTPEL